MISTRGRYALRVMIELAEHEGEDPVPLRDIAERQGISKKYLELIVRDLVRADLVVGASGRGGGYRLCREPSEYTVGEILEHTEGTLSCVACLKDKDYDCPRRSFCKTLPMWTEFDALVYDFFYGKRLSELMA